METFKTIQFKPKLDNISIQDNFVDSPTEGAENLNLCEFSVRMHGHILSANYVSKWKQKREGGGGGRKIN